MFHLVQNIASVLKPANVQGVSHDLPKRTGRGRDNRHSPNYKEVDGVEQENEGTVLSVKAVILFLEDFIEARLEKHTAHQEGGSDESVLAPWMRHKPSNNNSLENVLPDDAVKAYTRTAHCASHQPKASKVQNHESLRVVYSLIKDLRMLKARGVTHLSISSDYGFLDGIRSSVQRELSE